MSGVDTPQPAGVDVQPREDGGGELAAGELPGDGGVDLGGDVGQVEGVAAGGPVSADRDAGQHRGRQAVADGVDDQQVGGAAVDGVVEGVAADVVGRFQAA